MGQVQLNISSNIQDLIDRVAKLEGNVEKLNKETAQYGQTSKKAYDTATKEATELNKAQETNIKTTSKATQMYQKLAVGVAAAFSVTAVIAFAKAAARAWDEQEKANAKLLVALKGNEDAFRVLAKQANDLQKATLFADDQIQQAQSMLAFLTKDEQIIKRLTPLVLDFAQAKGMDLASAADLVSKSIGSSTNALARYGIKVEGAVGSSERLNDVVNGLTKAFGGQAEAATGAGLGGLTQLRNAWDDLLESFGAGAGRMGGVIKWLTDFTFFLGEAFKTVKQIKQEVADTTIASAFEEDAKEVALLSQKLQDAGMSATEADKRAKELLIIQLNKLKGYYSDNIEKVAELDRRIAELNKTIEINTQKTQEQIDAELKAYEEFTKIQQEKAALEQLISDSRAEAHNKLIEDLADEERAIAAQEEALKKQAEAVAKLKAALKELVEEYRDEETVDDIPFDTEAIFKEIERIEQFGEDHPIWEALGLTDEKQIEQIKSFSSQIFDLVNQIVDQQVEASQRLVDDLDQRINEQEELLNREAEFKAEGLANNYELERENLANMQKARDAAIKDREKQIKIQRTLSTIESSIALISAAANIIKGFSSIPVVGWVLGIAAVGAMIAAFIASQASIKDATQMERGGEVHHGLLKGKRHSQGGIPIEAEDGEYFINRRSSAKYKPLLEAINRDDKLYFNRTILNKIPAVTASGFDIDSSKRLGEIVRELKRGKAEVIYGDGFIIEKIGGYTKKINLN